MRIALFLGLAATACVLWVSQAHGNGSSSRQTPAQFSHDAKWMGLDLSGGPESGGGRLLGAAAAAYQYPGSTYAPPPAAPPATGPPPGDMAPIRHTRHPITLPAIRRPATAIRPECAGLCALARRPHSKARSRLRHRSAGTLMPRRASRRPAALPSDPYLPGRPYWPWPPGAAGACRRCSVSWTSFASITRGCPAMVPRSSACTRPT